MTPLLHMARHNLGESRVALVLLIGAVTAAVGFQVPNTANMDGYHAELLTHGLEYGLGDVRIRPRRGPRLANGREIAAALADHEGVRAAVPLLIFAGAVSHEQTFRAAPVFGVPAQLEGKPYHIIKGTPLEPGDEESVLLGSSLAEELGLDVGDQTQLRIVLGGDVAGLGDEEIGRYTMTVRGLVAGTFGAYQASFVDLDFLAREAGMPAAATMVVVRTDAHFEARGLADSINATFPDVQARSWLDDSQYLRSALHANRAVGRISEAMVVAAVLIPVLALLYINVLRRRREIGLLATVGFSGREVFTMYLLQAACVGIIGCLLGCLLGYGLVRYFQANPLFEWQGFVIQPVLSWQCFARPSLVVFAATLVAGAYPAWRAARIAPARVLRGLE